MLLVIGNIAPEATEEEFKSFVEQFGAITQVTLVTSGSPDNYNADASKPHRRTADTGVEEA